MKTTEGYGLNLFEGSDRLRTGPVNENTEKLEAALLDAVRTLTGTIETKVKIATGSYVGTGTYGEDYPCSLTFDFVPKVVIVQPSTESTIITPMVALYGSATYLSYNGSGSVTWSENTVSWMSRSGAVQTYNSNNRTYFYAAFA